MGRLRDFTKRLKQYTIQRQEKDLLAILKKHEAAAVDLNIRQMMEGETADGRPIEPEYTPFTVEIKKEKNQPYDRVTLRDEGDFHQAMFMSTDKWPVVFSSKDPKTGPLVRKYGEEIFGHNQTSRGELKDEINPDVKNYYGGIIHV
jgi:hypothetical protein